MVICVLSTYDNCLEGVCLYADTHKATTATRTCYKRMSVLPDSGPQDLYQCWFVCAV